MHQDPEVLLAATTVCRLLARFGDITMLSRHFMAIFRSQYAQRKQAALILTELVLGVSSLRSRQWQPCPQSRSMTGMLRRMLLRQAGLQCRA